MWLDESLPLRCRQVWHRTVLQVWCDDPQCVSRGFAFLDARQNHCEAVSKGYSGKFAVHVKNAARPRCVPPKKPCTARNRSGHAKRKKRLANASIRVEHRKSLLWQNRIEKHLAQLDFLCKQLFDGNSDKIVPPRKR